MNKLKGLFGSHHDGLRARCGSNSSNKSTLSEPTAGSNEAVMTACDSAADSKGFLAVPQQGDGAKLLLSTENQGEMETERKQNQKFFLSLR